AMRHVLAKYVRRITPRVRPLAETFTKAFKELEARAKVQTIATVQSSRSAKSRDATCKITIYPGNATVVRLPQGEYGMFDCGRRAALLMLPHLAELRVERLKFLALTHFDVDHVSGLSSILSQLRSIENIYLPADAFRYSAGGLSSRGSVVARLLSYAR